MRLDLGMVSRRRSLRPAAFDGSRNGRQRRAHEGGDLVGEHQQPRGDALQDGLGVGQIAGPVGRGLGAFVRGARQQRRQVVGQDLGRHVDQQCVLAEAEDGLQAQADLQALERLFDAPSLVVQRAEAVRWGRSAGPRARWGQGASIARRQRPAARGRSG